jgi:hypothetical protein
MQPVLRMSGGLRIAEVLTSSQKTKAFELGDASGQRLDGDPEWTDGLRRLYNSVVEEPLPSNFAELLAKLDQNS